RRAGVQGRLLFGAGNLYYAFLKRAEPVPECTNAISGQVSPAPKFDLYLATGAPDGALTNEIINLVGAVDDPGFVSDAFGIGAAVNGSGQPVLSVAAGGEGLFTCGSSDLVVIERTGANAFDIDAPSTDSADFSTLCTDLATANAGEVECCVDPACGSGTNVGPWSDVAISGGNTAVVFTDYHNFADQDGQTHQGVELWENNGGVSGVRPWSGLGQYASAEFAQDGSLIVAYTGYVGDGLFIVRRAGGTEFQGVNGTANGLFFNGYVIGERISVAVAPNGTVGVAFYAVEDPTGTGEDDLWLCESSDNGETFNSLTGCTIVEDPFLRVGAFPSLAYDSQSRPGISYNYCGPDSACSRDGLRYAWRDSSDNSGSWWYWNVHNVDNNRSGQYTSLVIDPGTDRPYIAFHDQTRGAAMLATGTFDGGDQGPCTVE
ncbi:MAG: hypothetical protein AAFQ82_18025, partial [Myxococcota bacterium]